MKKGLLCILVLLIGCTLFGCSNENQKVNVNDYAKIKPIGYDGYGKIDFEIDYASMFNNSSASTHQKETALRIAKEYDLYTIKSNDFENLKNGDSVKIEWAIDRNLESVFEELLNIDFTKQDGNCEIQGLKSIETLNPFDYLLINNHDTISGEGILDFEITFSKNGHNISIPVKHNGKNGELKNGDVLTLTINEEVDNEWFKENVGFDVNKIECEYIVTSLAEYANSEKALEYISKSNQQAIDTVADEWILSGLNDMADSNEIEPRTKEHVGYVYYCNNDGNGMLNSIYKIHDYFCGDYYVFIGLCGRFQYDNNGWNMDGESLPEMFIHYEKEKTRQSSNGTPQGNCEEMGFYSNDRLFAGKRDLEQTLMFLNNKYGNNYQHCFASNDTLKNAI